MSYISENLLPNERVIFYTKKNFIIFFIPVVCIILSAYTLTLKTAISPFVMPYIWWVPWAVTAILWLYTLLEYKTSEYAITNERLVLREGFFNRHESDLRLKTISQVNILQGPMGQVFNYGTISVNAFGAFDNFDYVANARQFKKLMNEQLYDAGSGQT